MCIRDSWCAALQGEQGGEGLARSLREAAPPIVARVESGETLLDPRTVAKSDDEHVTATIQALIRAESSGGTPS